MKAILMGLKAKIIKDRRKAALDFLDKSDDERKQNENNLAVNEGPNSIKSENHQSKQLEVNPSKQNSESNDHRSRGFRRS